MANNPYLYPMKYLLFYIISLLSLTACIHEELPPEGGFALEDLNVYSLFADNTIPRVFLADKDGTIILTQTEKVDAGLLISGGVEPHPYKPEKS